MEQMQRAHEEELHRASFHGPDALSPPPPEPQRRDDAVTTELNTLRAELDTAKQVNAKLEQERAELSTKLNADIAAVADEQHAKKLAQVELELQDYKQKAENADVDIEAVQQLRTNFRKAILALDQLKEENSLLAKTSSMGAPRGLKPRAPRRGCFSSLCTLVGYFFTMVTIAAIVLAGVYGS
jgi:DNA repair exonuclease SbcCD ATPase subunit